MEGRPPKRFLCEHQVFPDLDMNVINRMHGAARKGLRVLYTFSNLDEKCMYSVIEGTGRRAVELFLSELGIPCDTVMEVEAQGQEGQVEDLRRQEKAA